MARLTADRRGARRRAIVLVVLPALLALAAIGAPAASAEIPAPPRLLATNPASPGTSLTPTIQGTVDGGITRRMNLDSEGGGTDLGPVYVVDLYTNPSCTGAPVATGSGDQLGAAGIPVTVLPDSTTTFYATATNDTAETSACSSGITYQQVTTAPSAPVVTGTNPASPANDNNPKVRGSAVPNSIVFIYDNPTCTGTPLANGSAATFSGAGIGVYVADDSTTTFYANVTLAGIASPCSSTSATYAEVTNPPVVRPDMPLVQSVAPASPANDNTPKLGGTAPAGSTVRVYGDPSCSGPELGSGSAEAFAGGALVANVEDDTTTTFYATATVNGVVSDCSVSFVTYREDSTAPRTPSVQTPTQAASRESTPRITGSAPGAARIKIYDSAGCKGAALINVSIDEFEAGVKIRVPENQTTSLYAIAIDAAGNQSPCSDAAAYTQDSLAPKTRITMGPGAKTRKRTLVFRFKDTTGGYGTTFKCKLDRRKWKTCHSPAKYKGVKMGRHTFQVKAVDAAGNVERKPVKRRVKVIH